MRTQRAGLKARLKRGELSIVALIEGLRSTSPRPGSPNCLKALPQKDHRRPLERQGHLAASVAS